jgi:hypothetical protein
MAETRVIRPQEGYQMKVLSSPADIVIGGAAAGVGKTFSLLMDPLRHIEVKGFGGVIFRRTSPQIRSEGGLWDTSMGLYPYTGATPKESFLEWHFPKGAKFKFSHLEHEKNILDWQGAQIPFIGFDELTHFTKKMFFYLLSRNRSTCGIKPYVRATLNPDPESWVFELIKWWINEDTGDPIPERDGVVRYFVVDGENYIWGDTEEEAVEAAWHILEAPVKKSGIPAREFVKSLTFISGSIYENKELLSVNPAYLANLMAQDEQLKLQLLYGNWKVVLNDNDIYDYYKFAGMFDNLYKVEQNGKCITADIALEGRNKLAVGYWEGNELADLSLVDKSKGDKVVNVISDMARTYKVANNDIVFDADGVGGFVDGFIPGAVPFHGGAPVVEVKDPVSGKVIKENYFNLKAQCYYRSGKRVARGEMAIRETVANMMYDEKMTVRQRFMHERKAIKRDKVDSDGKHRLITKGAMKAALGGESPDLMDMFMMKEFLELKPKMNWQIF